MAKRKKKEKIDKEITSEEITNEDITSEEPSPDILGISSEDITSEEIVEENVTEEIVEENVTEEIIRGRMPLSIVKMIKFHESDATSLIAAKYRTTIGKIDDIQKNHNFKYIEDDFTQDADMVLAAEERCKQLKDGAGIMVVIKSFGTDPEAAIKLAVKRAAIRPKAVKKAKKEDAVVEEKIGEVNDETLPEILDIPESNFENEVSSNAPNMLEGNEELNFDNDDDLKDILED